MKIKYPIPVVNGIPAVSHGQPQRKRAGGGDRGPSGGREEGLKTRQGTEQHIPNAPPAAEEQGSSTSVLSAAKDGLRSPGRPLDPEVRAEMEPRFGHDFSHVRVHTNSEAADSARSVNAAAYTVGHDVVFGPGRYEPQSGEGRRLIAHELAHTVQQREGDPLAPISATESETEGEADRAAGAAVSGGAAAVASGSHPISLARQAEEGTDQGKVFPPGTFLREFRSRAEPETGYWDTTARRVFGAASYDAYCASLSSTTFFGAPVDKVNPDLIQMLKAAETDLGARKGPGYKPPHIDSTLRKKKAMHGWGMAIDFDVIRNPYVLHESGEQALDVELLKSYDRIAQFMLGRNSSDLRKLTGGRAAFGGTISAAYDALRQESDAMKRYFSMMNDDAALGAFLSGEWAAMHAGQQPPEIAAVKAAMRSDYEALGGATATGAKRPVSTGGDRPFAPSSSGGQGDPATGFLNLEKDLVEAMTDAGFAWGAVDIRGEPGDVQHFDLRLSGAGKRAYDLML